MEVPRRSDGDPSPWGDPPPRTPLAWPAPDMLIVNRQYRVAPHAEKGGLGGQSPPRKGFPLDAVPPGCVMHCAGFRKGCPWPMGAKPSCHTLGKIVQSQASYRTLAPNLGTVCRTRFRDGQCYLHSLHAFVPEA